MKRYLKGFMVSGIIAAAFCITSYAANYDFENMTTAELQSVKQEINEEIKANHELSSEQESAVKEAVTAYVEAEYGEENVGWAWFDYTYSKEWDYYTMKTHADIKKQDGGSAQYDVLGEVYAVVDDYRVVYVQIGTEEIFNKREEEITDQRILTMLGLSSENGKEADTEGSVKKDEKSDTEMTVEKVPEAKKETEAKAETETEAEAETETKDIVLAQRGDKGDNVLEIQQMLARLGYLSSTPDGTFGERTENAVKQFQVENGLIEDGIITQSVYDKLKEASDAAPEQVEVISVSAYDLYNQFDSNAIAAKEKYTGKVIQVSGTIDDVNESVWGTPYVSLKADEWGFTTVDCYFSKEDASELAGLSSGQGITIKGTCAEEVFANVEVKDCSIVY